MEKENKKEKKLEFKTLRDFMMMEEMTPHKHIEIGEFKFILYKDEHFKEDDK